MDPGYSDYRKEPSLTEEGTRLRNYGDDSPLYGAMGFVRMSEKKSGLTRKKKPTEYFCLGSFMGFPEGQIATHFRAW